MFYFISATFSTLKKITPLKSRVERLRDKKKKMNLYIIKKIFFYVQRI
ncbi:hypothetical protein [Flavobacterium phage 2A]|uniref:Uncharacterized protein n=1 Tax=Flavobacterium phage 2A TaxID=1792273 RepID=A0A1B0WM61_9CAUD|nr:hypothetical protein BOX10_gp56 [Flavobacterium phage 2A]ANB40967.1 hypothetical protein [Flavobacterium phage 2A]